MKAGRDKKNNRKERQMRREKQKREGIIGAFFPGYRKLRAEQWGAENPGMRTGTHVCVGAPMHL